MKRSIPRICKNCQLYNPAKSECAIVVIHEGQRLHLPVLPKDPCFFEGEFFNPTTEAVEDFAGDIQQVKFWVENEKGEKVKGNGTVKMEYPEGFLGTEEMFKIDDDDLDIFEWLKTRKDLET